ncbi:hypothetical protein ASD12_31705 [Mesorhizobium sp. Root102]|nr:hypothetical protein ASD12_31705 [Mesorhizobium sp. Root102]KRB29933.1 hypothetical protein ASE05_30530 [Mesorhizobium sp. Root172]
MGDMKVSGKEAPDFAYARYIIDRIPRSNRHLLRPADGKIPARRDQHKSARLCVSTISQPLGRCQSQRSSGRIADHCHLHRPRILQDFTQQFAHGRHYLFCGVVGCQWINRNDTAYLGSSGEVADNAPVGANDLIDIAAAVQEDHDVATFTMCGGRCVIDWPSSHVLSRHLDAAPQSCWSEENRPQC